MVELTSERRAELLSFIEAQRARCLWYLRPEWRPGTADEMWRTLDAIQKHGDRAAFMRAGEMKRWLPRTSSGESAAS